MHRHLYVVRRPATPFPNGQVAVRPAKVVQLEVRRQANLEARNLEAARRRPTKPAA